jgi:hypothetical protein
MDNLLTGVGSEQQRRIATLIPQARDLLNLVEDRILALGIAATMRWEQDAHATDRDEHEPPVFGDEEYDAMLSLVQSVSEHAWFQEIAKFFGLPEEVINKTLEASLRAEATGSLPGAKSSIGHVVVRKHPPVKGEM